MESKLVFEILESDPDGIIDASEQILNVQGTQFYRLPEMCQSILHWGEYGNTTSQYYPLPLL